MKRPASAAPRLALAFACFAFPAAIAHCNEGDFAAPSGFSGSVTQVEASADAGAPSDAGFVCVFEGSDASVDAGGDDTSDAGDAGDASDAARAPPATFSAVYDQIITPICNECHSNPKTPSGNLEMGEKCTAFTHFINVKAQGSGSLAAGCGQSGLFRVVPGDPVKSLLYLKVLGAQPCGAQMPFGEDPLPTDQVQLIGDWIEAGAKYN